jgi:hypothetical protein
MLLDRRSSSWLTAVDSASEVFLILVQTEYLFPCLALGHVLYFVAFSLCSRLSIATCLQPVLHYPVRLQLCALQLVACDTLKPTERAMDTVENVH